MITKCNQSIIDFENFILTKVLIIKVKIYSIIFKKKLFSMNAQVKLHIKNQSKILGKA